MRPSDTRWRRVSTSPSSSCSATWEVRGGQCVCGPGRGGRVSSETRFRRVSASPSSSCRAVRHRRQPVERRRCVCSGEEGRRHHRGVTSCHVCMREMHAWCSWAPQTGSGIRYPRHAQGAVYNGRPHAPQFLAAQLLPAARYQGVALPNSHLSARPVLPRTWLRPPCPRRPVACSC